MHRREHWYILQGAWPKIEIEYDDVIQTESGRDEIITLKTIFILINRFDWHRAFNHMT